MQSASWILWNLFLAAIPAALAYLFAYGAERFTVRKKKVPWLAWTPLALGWFAFLPNTCYLLTELRHFLLDPVYGPIFAAAKNDSSAMLTVAEFGLFFALYSGFGVVCFVLAIRPVERLMREAKIPRLPFAAPFFFLMSLGVYLGLIERLNSWNVINHPAIVLRKIFYALTTPHLVRVIIAFAIVLWFIYQLGDVWADGMALRLRQRGLLPKSRSKSG